MINLFNQKNEKHNQIKQVQKKVMIKHLQIQIQRKKRIQWILVLVVKIQIACGFKEQIINQHDRKLLIKVIHDYKDD